MGFLLFLAGTLDAKRQINRKSYELMCVTSRLKSIQSNINMIKQTQGSLENSWSSITGNASTAALSLFQMSTNSNQTELNKVMEQYKKDPNSDAAKIAIKQATDNMNNANVAAQNVYQTSLAAIGAVKQGVNSVFEASNKLQLEYLANEESQIDNQKVSLEAELTVLNEEYQNDKKAMQAAAKDVAPTFGLG